MFSFARYEILTLLKTMPPFMLNILFCPFQIIVRKCDALEAESEKLKADLDVMKQQNQAFEASQGANVQLLFAKLEQAKEKLRLFVRQFHCHSLISSTLFLLEF